jgi:hypothetical protein
MAPPRGSGSTPVDSRNGPTGTIPRSIAEIGKHIVGFLLGDVPAPRCPACGRSMQLANEQIMDWHQECSVVELFYECSDCGTRSRRARVVGIC